MAFEAASFGIPMNHGIAILLFAFAMVIGYSGHRANLCGVAAVSEIIKTRRCHMLASFGKAILWAALVSFILGFIMPEGSVDQRTWSLSAVSLLGGVTFGIGAAINNACAISTLTRIADGNAGLLFTLVGLTLGIGIHAILLSQGMVPPAVLATPLVSITGPLLWTVFGALVLFALKEVFVLWKHRGAGESLKSFVVTHKYKLAVAALLIGSSNAFLNHFGGTWSYTAAFSDFLEADMGPVADSSFSPFLFAGVLVGMFVSSIQLKKFHVRIPGIRVMSKHLVGGIFMGFGTALIPGGNDTLLFEYIPGLSPHGLPVFGGIVLGIYLVLKARRLRNMSWRLSTE